MLIDGADEFRLCRLVPQLLGVKSEQDSSLIRADLPFRSGFAVHDTRSEKQPRYKGATWHAVLEFDPAEDSWPYGHGIQLFAPAKE